MLGLGLFGPKEICGNVGTIGGFGSVIVPFRDLSWDFGLLHDPV